jgi:hypothetical protein
MRFWIRTLKYRDLHAPYQLVDARDALLEGLRHLGHEASTEDGDRQIVLAAQLATPATAKTIPDDSIIWNLEQAGNFHFSPEYQVLMKRCTTWDYNHVNMQRMKKLYDIDTKYCPMGWVPGLDSGHPDADDYDVMFIGSLAFERRKRIIKDLQGAGLRVFASNNCYRPERERITCASRVFLNMHCHEEMIMESLRLALGMANKRAVVCECNPQTAADHDLLPGILPVPYEKLVEACVAVAKNKELQRDLGVLAYETFTKRPMWDVLRPLI